jgi:hypothetical protein
VDQEFYQRHASWLSAYVKKISNYYLRTEASTGRQLGSDEGILLRNSYATPRLMEPLLVSLRVATDEIDPRMAALLLSPLGSAQRIAQTLIDWKDWRERLEIYEEEWAAAMQTTPDASGLENFRYWDEVTRPLLLGIYPGSPVQRVLDAVTPYVLAHELNVDERSMRDAFEQLKKDLKENVKTTLEIGAGVGFAIAAVALLVLIKK